MTNPARLGAERNGQVVENLAERPSADRGVADEQRLDVRHDLT
jgi:hypothetical protein